MAHWNADISREIQQAVAGLPLYRGGPGVDYTHAPVCYAINVTVTHVPGFDYRRPDRVPVTFYTPALLVQRAAGYGVINSWSGVSGFVDVVTDPTGQMPEEEFDPLEFTVCKELAEECRFTYDVLARTAFFLGERFEVTSHNGGRLNVFPVLGIYGEPARPAVTPDPREIGGYEWVPLGQIPALNGINEGYVQNTFPRVLQLARIITG